MRAQVIALCALASLAIAAASVALASSSSPKTTITGGPLGQSDSTTARFSFSADQPSSFQCQLDGGPFAACTSPYVAGPLSVGSHEFSVRATSSAGVADPSPPVRQWLIVPPITAPVVKLARPSPRRLRASSLRQLSGTASAPSGVVAVELALQRGGANKNFFPPRCSFVDLRTGATRRQACVLPAYTPAHGTDSWRLALPKAVRRGLAPGRYDVIVRALNRLHNGGPQRFSLTITH